MKRNPYLNYTRLPMENAYNVRELGGYATKKGSITIHHQFLRSENLTDITEEDKTFLIEYGLSGIIDLRSREEALIYPNPFRGNNAVKYINCPLITDGILDLRAVTEVGFDPGEFYVKLVEYKEMLYKIFHFILDNIDGCLLFHCQAGKDRTGTPLGFPGALRQSLPRRWNSRLCSACRFCPLSPTLPTTYALVWKKHAMLSAAAQAFMQVLKQP